MKEIKKHKKLFTILVVSYLLFAILAIAFNYWGMKIGYDISINVSGGILAGTISGLIVYNMTQEKKKKK